MRELVEAYDEYVNLLCKEMEGLFGLAFAHGYKCADDRVKRGEELRARIGELKQELKL